MTEDSEEEILVYDSDYFQSEDDTVEIKPTYIKREWKDNSKEL